MTHNTTFAFLFPLNTVLFPGSILQLKIFEQRYLSLIKTCMKNQHGFVVVLIDQGKEVNDTPSIHSIGTYVEIIDFESLDNGLLGITIKAEHKVWVNNTKAQHDGLLHGEIEAITDASLSNQQLAIKYRHLHEVLKSLVQHPLLKTQYANIDYQSAIEVSYRLCEFLPISNTNKQDLLETADVDERFIKIESFINQMQS